MTLLPQPEPIDVVFEEVFESLLQSVQNYHVEHRTNRGIIIDVEV